MVVATHTIERNVRAALETLPSIRELRLIGSRATGDAGPLSDWDFEVVTDDFLSAACDAERTLAGLHPLTAQWDRLAPHACYMLIVPGPTKIDFLFLDEPHELDPPGTVSAETLPDIDAHFWDWTIWLAAKDAASKRKLVAEELRKMHEHILAPMGVASMPDGLEEAIRAYERVRARFKRQYETSVPRELDTEVRRILKKHGYKL